MSSSPSPPPPPNNNDPTTTTNQDHQDITDINNDNSSSSSSYSENDDDDNDDSDDSSSSLGPKMLPNRTTRGRRTKQVDPVEAEADEQFYNQDAWKSEQEDEEIASEDFASSDFGDSSDSDIDLDETEETNNNTSAPGAIEEKDIDDVDGKKRTSRKGYIDPALARAKQQRHSPRKSSSTSSPSKKTKVKKQVTIAPHAMEIRTSTTKRLAESNQRILTESKKKRQKGLANDSRPTTSSTNSSTKAIVLTQRELLEAAARTEVENMQSLKTTMFLEAEKKRLRAAEANRQKNKGPRIIFKSHISKSLPKEEINTILYTDPNTFPTPSRSHTSNSKSKSRLPVCAITGLPAKYLDPVTNKYYANIQAFKILRMNTTNRIR
jgi:vacuolar protein sorting-associated protein 72